MALVRNSASLLRRRVTVDDEHSSKQRRRKRRHRDERGENPTGCWRDFCRSDMMVCEDDGWLDVPIHTSGIRSRTQILVHIRRLCMCHLQDVRELGPETCKARLVAQDIVSCKRRISCEWLRISDMISSACAKGHVCPFVHRDLSKK